MRAFVAIVFVLTLRLAGAFYSISYSGDSAASVANAGSSFVSAPTAEHVADVFARLSGHAPLYKSDNERLPTLDILSTATAQPVTLLEVTGGRLPSDVLQVVRATAFDGEAMGPSLESVVNVLTTHGISVSSKKMEGHGDASTEVAEYLRSLAGKPVIILHHESPSSYHFIRRDLEARKQSGSVPTLTEFQISQYQICLWTGVMMVMLIGSALCGMLRMEVIPDSLLFAKFISTRTNKHD